jgi:putative ABC transport system permease protein
VSTFLQIFRQSLILSFEEIRAAKLRSFLSLLGITIGILCIISVRTAVNSLEMNIQKSLASFGNDILYIQKWPWIWSDNYEWWRYLNRPAANRRELEQLQERVKGAKASAMIYLAGNSNVLAGDAVAEGASIQGVTYDYDKIKNLEFTQGRYFTTGENNGAQAVALIGANVAESLFGDSRNVEGSEIKVNGVQLKVIGVLKKEGSDLFGFTLDNNVLLPYSFMSKVIFMGDDPLIAVVPKDNVPIEELKYELKGVMRSIRRLSPYEEDNFAVNQVSVFTEGIASIFSIINVAGMFIGAFSILVGTFGIANIMFVSVQERVYQIGIKKALGAKKIYILLEFLLEAVMLCVFGGIAGLLFVVGLFAFFNWLIIYFESDFHFYITAQNLMIGISISVITGVLAGFIPAYSAANMKPVDAIRGEVSDLFAGIKSIFKVFGPKKT